MEEPLSLLSAIVDEIPVHVACRHGRWKTLWVTLMNSNHLNTELTIVQYVRSACLAKSVDRGPLGEEYLW